MEVLAHSADVIDLEERRRIEDQRNHLEAVFGQNVDEEEEYQKMLDMYGPEEFWSIG